MMRADPEDGPLADKPLATITRLRWLFAALLLAIAVPALAQQVPEQQLSTLEIVRARGFLICGASDPLPGFAQRSEEGLWSGFDVDFCRAVAAAVFGDANKVEFRALSGDARFAQLQTGTIDVIARNASWTIGRDTRYHVMYVGSAFFDGQAFMVPQSLNVVSAYELRDISLCIQDGADELAALREFSFSNQAQFNEVLYEDREDLQVAYRAGLCTAVSAPASWLYAIRRSLPEPGAHRILPERISKESFGPVVRAGDDQWFNLVKWTLFTLINAEEYGVTSVNTDALLSTRTTPIKRLLGLDKDFGAPLGLSPTFMREVITAVGNYGEIFERNFGSGTGAGVLRGQNALWTQGGLLFAPPIR
jgi:general L-amino acid transport system substrate-binding protein